MPIEFVLYETIPEICVIYNNIDDVLTDILDLILNRKIKECYLIVQNNNIVFDKFEFTNPRIHSLTFFNDYDIFNEKEFNTFLNFY